MPLDVESTSDGTDGGSSSVDIATSQVTLILIPISLSSGSPPAVLHVNNSEGIPTVDWLSLDGSDDAVLASGIYNIVISVVWGGTPSGRLEITSNAFTFTDVKAASSIQGASGCQHLYSEIVKTTTSLVFRPQIAHALGAPTAPDEAAVVITKIG